MTSAAALEGWLIWESGERGGERRERRELNFDRRHRKKRSGNVATSTTSGPFDLSFFQLTTSETAHPAALLLDDDDKEARLADGEGRAASRLDKEERGEGFFSLVGIEDFGVADAREEEDEEEAAAAGAAGAGAIDLAAARCIHAGRLVAMGAGIDEVFRGRDSQRERERK